MAKRTPLAEQHEPDKYPFYSLWLHGNTCHFQKYYLITFDPVLSDLNFYIGLIFSININRPARNSLSW